MFNAQWLCENQEWLSVLMVIGSIVGTVGGIYGLVIGICKLTDIYAKWKRNQPFKESKPYKPSMLERLKIKYGHEVVDDKIYLIGIGALLFVLTCIVGVWQWAFILGVLQVALIVSVAMAMVAVTVYLDQKFPWLERVYKPIAIMVVSAAVLFIVGLALFVLYKWWVLLICGS